MDEQPGLLHKSQPVPAPIPVFVDTDIGDDIDDALALALLLCLSEVEVVGVSTVFGDTYLRARLVAYLLQTFGRPDIPVAAGQEQPMQFRHRPSGVCQAVVLPNQASSSDLAHTLSSGSPVNATKSNSHLSLSSLSGSELLLQMARMYPGQLTLLCLGPLTNVALALQKEPDLGSRLRQVFFMGGSSSIFWPDWNVRSDALAALLFLQAHLPVTMIGFNVTFSCHLQASEVACLYSARSPRLHLLARLITAWQAHQPWWRSHLPGLHDPLVVAALCAPQLFRFASLPVHVFTRGPCAGWTVPHWLNGSPVRAALSVDCARARIWILQRLFSSNQQKQ